MIPIWYLDVDGVLNVVNIGSPADEPPECFRTELVGQYPITWDTRVVEFINQVHRDGLVEIVWLTTWGERAVTRLAPVLGLDEFRLPSKSAITGLHGDAWWKWVSIMRHAEEDRTDERAVIWTDDDLAYSLRIEHDLQDWVDRRQKLGLETLGISPKSYRGLTMAHLDEIKKLLDRAKEQAA